MFFFLYFFRLLFYILSFCFYVEVDSFIWIIVLLIGKLRKVVVNLDLVNKNKLRFYFK